ncbi:hypothetical protein EJ110_NYTH32562 [Nymphaea thermarum]|nr:hypothetical protein EJ110_NYTH32562 [Nymphaea thermarum]
MRNTIIAAALAFLTQPALISNPHSGTRSPEIHCSNLMTGHQQTILGWINEHMHYYAICYKVGSYCMIHEKSQFRNK